MSDSVIEKSEEVGQKPRDNSDAISVFILIVIGVLFVIFLFFYSSREGHSFSFTTDEIKNAAAYIASWFAIGILSFAACQQIKEIMHNRRGNLYLTRANQIAMMIGLVLIIFLFKQPYLTELFKDSSPDAMAKIFLLGGSASTGWLVWYLKNLKLYGEFFHVLLLTLIIGFCLYARLTNVEQVQLTAAAFLTGSLFHLAKSYIEEANKKAPL